MDPDRYEVWLAGGAGGPLWERARDAHLRTIEIPSLVEEIDPRRDPAAFAALIRLMRRESFSLVHTHSAKAGFIGRLAARLTHVPLVIHTFHSFPFHDFMTAGRHRLYVQLERAARPLTDAFIAVSPRVAREAVEMRVARPGTIRVVPSSIEVDAVPREPEPALRRELGLSAERPVVGTVGRFVLQKAPLDFVRMASRVAKERPDAQFVMVGDASQESRPLEEATKAEAERLGLDIHFTGYRSDAPRVAALFDVFVISSLYEGLGRSLTEALASGRPVAATSVNGVPDLVIPGATGLLAPPGRPEDLARCVLWLLDHPEEARRMGEQGRDSVRSSVFSPATMCGLLDAEYSRLLGLPVHETEAPLHGNGNGARRRAAGSARAPTAHHDVGD
jgi:glycosyltransferase involved in cell wall biosynthesis